MGNEIPSHTGTPPMCLRCGKNNHNKILLQGTESSLLPPAKASNTHPTLVPLYPKPLQPQMAKPQTLPAHQAWMGEAREPIHQIHPKTRERSHRTKTSRRIGIHKQPQTQQTGTSTQTIPPRVNRNVQPPHHGHSSIPPTSARWIHAYTPHPLHHSNLARLLSNKILTLLLLFNRWPNCIDNILRPVRTRQKPSRTSPVPHPSLPLVGCIPIYDGKGQRQATTLVITSDQPYYRDPPRTWLRSSDPWKRNSHMTN